MIDKNLFDLQLKFILQDLDFVFQRMVPPHWEDLLKHSSKKATDEEFSLEED